MTGQVSTAPTPVAAALRSVIKKAGAGARSRLGLLILAGILLRLLLMPFFAHGDLLTVYWRSHLWVDRNQFRSVGFQLPIGYLHAAFLRGLEPVLPQVEIVWPPELDGKSLDSLSSTDDWKILISRPQIYRTLFLLKLPYLAFDIGCLLILWLLLEGKQGAYAALAFWWLNPLLIYGTYIYGRHDVLAQFFVLLAVLLLARLKRLWALIALGIGVALRFYPVILLPFLILPIRSWKQGLRWALLALLPFLLAELYARVFLGYFTVSGLTALSHNSYFMAARLPLTNWDNLYIFPLLYGLLVLSRIYDPDASWQAFARYGLLCMLAFFAFADTGQSVHYWLWMLPFLTLAVAEDRRLIPLSLAQCCFLVMYSFVGGRATAGYLLGSISPDFFWSLPAPAEIIGRYVPIETFISLVHSGLTAITLWIGWLVLQPEIRKWLLGRQLQKAGE
jgi:hypothetical protein